MVILACPESLTVVMPPQRFWIATRMTRKQSYMKSGYVYIMANSSQTLYTGVTSNLVQRIYQHKNNLVRGFTQRYQLHMLVYYEMLDTIEQAIIREKQIKDMNRADKLKMIYKFNPTFTDLYAQVNI